MYINFVFSYRYPTKSSSIEKIFIIIYIYLYSYKTHLNISGIMINKSSKDIAFLSKSEMTISQNE